MYITDKHIALSMLQAKLDCIERSTSANYTLCDSNCDDCYLNYAQGNMAEQINAQKQNS